MLNATELDQLFTLCDDAEIAAQARADAAEHSQLWTERTEQLARVANFRALRGKIGEFMIDDGAVTPPVSTMH